MPRTKAKPEKPDLSARTRSLRNQFKRVAPRVKGTTNEADFDTFLAYCEKRLCTFDPDHATWTDYPAKRAASREPPKKTRVIGR